MKNKRNIGVEEEDERSHAKSPALRRGDVYTSAAIFIRRYYGRIVYIVYE